MARLARFTAVVAASLLAGACVTDHPATIIYTWTPAYPPAMLAIQLGDQRIAGEAIEIDPSNPNTLEITTQAPTGSTSLRVDLVSGRDTLAAATTRINFQAGQRFFLKISAGELAPGYVLSCAQRLPTLLIRGGQSTDSLAIQWYQTSVSDVLGPC